MQHSRHQLSACPLAPTAQHAPTRRLTVVVPQRLHVDASCLIVHAGQFLGTRVGTGGGDCRGLGRGVGHGPTRARRPAPPPAAAASVTCLMLLLPAAEGETCTWPETAHCSSSRAAVRVAALLAAAQSENIGTTLFAPAGAWTWPATRPTVAKHPWGTLWAAGVASEAVLALPPAHESGRNRVGAHGAPFRG